MTETTCKGWVMVNRRNPTLILDFTFSGERRGAISGLNREFPAFSRRQVLRRYKPVKATMSITLEDE